MNVEKARELLGKFDFHSLFVEELGWSQPTARKPVAGEAGGVTYSRRMIAQLAGVAVFEISTNAGLPAAKARDAIEREIAKEYRENLCIFLEREKSATQSFWIWAKRGRNEEGRVQRVLREHSYFRGQPGDLFISKLQALFFEMSEVSEDSQLTVVKVAERLRNALDVEKITKRFFRDYQDKHTEFIELIEGIDDDRDRRWYASIVLNRLMFVWFMQKKGFLDHDATSGRADYEYLPGKLEHSKSRGKDLFYAEFLKALFFEAFAKPESDRSKKSRTLCGTIPYLNGGLFLPHRIESEPNGGLRVGKTLHIPDRAFENLFALFSSYSWNLNDTPGGKADEINPDVLGYIFEKYVNVVSSHSQKDLGAYYTRPEITDYLAERTIEALVLERIRAPAIPELKLPAVEFDSVPEMLARMDGPLARSLLDHVLPGIKILDPAVGSGAFLVAAMKVLIGIYSAIVGRAELGNDRELKAWLGQEKKKHRNMGYAIRRRIITDNLYGVDFLEEAAEIGKLRLFLALIASVQHVDEIEPLPNIDFNIMPGNALVGLMRVDEHEFDNKQDDLFTTPFRVLLEEKNRLRATYRSTAEALGPVDLQGLRQSIEENDDKAVAVLNKLLCDEFSNLGIPFEQTTWDARHHKIGRVSKRKVTPEDVRVQRPFHWGYEFDEILHGKGGFDIILTNPPWETFKPQTKEFFAEHSDLVTKNSMTFEDFEKEQTKLLKFPEIRESWLEYQSRFPHMNAYFRQSAQYAHQVALSDGKRIVTDLNLYKLFIEQCLHLLRPGGHCGIVIPSGIYTDLGAKGLRELLFQNTRIEGLFGFENRKRIFEGVDSRFKFVVLTFKKLISVRVHAAGERNASAPPDDLLAPSRRAGTQAFPAAFMRLDVAELVRFPTEGAISIPIDVVRKLAPDSLAIPEFRSVLDVELAKKLFHFPRLGDSKWALRLCREFHMTDDAPLYETARAKSKVPLIEGKMLHQFDANFAEPRFWIDERKGRAALLATRLKRSAKVFRDAGARVEPDEDRIRLDCDTFRLAFRDVARNTDERTFIGTILPPRRFCPHTVSLEEVFYDSIDGGGKPVYNVTSLNVKARAYLLGMMNSFVADFMLRQRVTAHLSFFFIENLPIPEFDAGNQAHKQVVESVARLVCVTEEFDPMAQELGIGSHMSAVRVGPKREQLRADLDGLAAHLFGLSEDEFAHVLSTFPLVSDAVKNAARNAYRDRAAMKTELVGA